MIGARRVDVATLLVAISLLVPLALLGTIALFAWRSAWEDAAAGVQQAAATVAEYGQRELTLHGVAAGRVDTLLQGLSDAQIRAREGELHAVLRRLVQEIPGTETAHVLDRHGGLLVSTRVFPVPRGTTPGADRDYFLALGSEDPPQVHLSGVHVGRLDGATFFAISRRRTGSGNADVPPGGFDGVVNLSIFPASLTAPLQRLRHAESDFSGLLREDGVVLGRSTGVSRPLRAAAPVVATMASGQEKAVLMHRAAVEGTDYLVALQRIEGWPAYAVAGRPRASILAEWRREVAEQLALGLPATLALFAAALASRRSQRRLAAARDELELRVAERTAALAEEEARLRRALEAGRVFAFTTDLVARRVERSPNATEILGLPPEEPLREIDAALARIHPDDLPQVRAAFDSVTPASPVFTVEYRWRRFDGRLAWLRNTGTGHFAPDGRLLTVTGLARDITAEVEAEQARHRSEARLRAAAEGAGLGIYEIDFANGLAWFDARGSKVAGGILPAERWIAVGGPEWQALDAAIHPEDRAAYAAAWEAVASGEAEGWSLETRIRRPDGSWSWDWCHGVVVERAAGSGRPLRLVGILQDVSAPRRLEAELRQSQKLQVLGELSGGIAHDFNNVLQAVGAAARTIEGAAEDPAGVRRRAAMLHAAVARGAAITGRLLAFTRRSEMHREEVAPGPLLAELREILAATLGARIAVALDVAAGLPPLRTDREQLLTVLLNLATNARDAMPQGGTLTLSADCGRPGPGEAGSPALAPGQYLRLAVRDTGTGMDAATLARVAEPFFTTKPAGQGTGLGLSLARQFAEQAGGALRIASAAGRGTTVTLWLPPAGPEAGGA